ncbi:hypothetical protein BaRGS_00022976 [Batillaria attramentaria]|uniref:Uncharacterized protein n=1 Tax=Batillaria attramentaria TaxID=370345 RepID=A0ABD0KFM6_9CAEN
MNRHPSHCTHSADDSFVLVRASVCIGMMMLLRRKRLNRHEHSCIRSAPNYRFYSGIQRGSPSYCVRTFRLQALFSGMVDLSRSALPALR